MRQMLLAITWLIISTPAAAQILEVGGGVSRGRVGSEGGVCGDETGAMWAIYSVARDDRFKGVRPS